MFVAGGRPRMAVFVEQIEQAASLWRQSARAIALTGAGLSTGSGIPDFRSPQLGVWSSADPLRVASLTTFRYAPEEFFAWVRPLAGQIRRAAPNAAHGALATLEAQGKLHIVITQNIDELHRRAGHRRVLELHGSLETATCVRCWRVWPAAALVDQLVADGRPPACPGCGGLGKAKTTRPGEQPPLGGGGRSHPRGRRVGVVPRGGPSA